MNRISFVYMSFFLLVISVNMNLYALCGGKTEAACKADSSCVATYDFNTPKRFLKCDPYSGGYTESGNGASSSSQAEAICDPKNRYYIEYMHNNNTKYRCGGCKVGYVDKAGSCVVENNESNEDVIGEIDCSKTPNHPSCNDQNDDEAIGQIDCNRTPYHPECKKNYPDECVPDADNTPPDWCNEIGSLDCEKTPSHPMCQNQNNEDEAIGGIDCEKTPNHPQCQNQNNEDEAIGGIDCTKTPDNPACSQEEVVEEVTEETCDNGKAKACKLGTPLARAIGAGVMSGISGIVWGATNKEVHRIEKNIAELEKVRDAIVANRGNAITGCSDTNRDDPENARCYCYTSSGSVNNNRDPQGVCAALFPYYIPPSVGSSPTLQGCVNLQGQFDRDCACRSQTENGQNNCQKITSIPQGSLGQGALKEIGNAASSTNALLSGNIAGAETYNVNGGKALANLAKKKLDTLLKKESGTLDKVIGNQIKLLASNPKLQKAGQGSDMKSAGLSSIASGLPKSAKDSLDKNTKGILASADKGYVGGAKRGQRRQSLNDNDDFAIGDSASIDIDNINNDEELMAKNYNYRNSDVFQNPSASIFKLLSVRYQRSAYKRLFEEQDILKSDSSPKTKRSK